MLELKAEPLTPEAFAPFGDVIDTRIADSFPINAGRTRRYHDLARVETLGEEARALISIFVSQPVEVPLELDFLERHPQGSQAFMPLHEERFLVVVAPPGTRLIRPRCAPSSPTAARASTTAPAPGTPSSRCWSGKGSSWWWTGAGPATTATSIRWPSG